MTSDITAASSICDEMLTMKGTFRKASMNSSGSESLRMGLDPLRRIVSTS